MLSVYKIYSKEFHGFIFVILANLVNSFIVYFNTTFYFIVTIFGPKTQYCVLFTFKHSLFAYNQLNIYFLIRGLELGLNYQYYNLNDILLYHQQMIISEETSKLIYRNKKHRS